MRAFVMAAGIGTRLRPLTYAVPKPMVPVANKPVLEYTFDLLVRSGIKDIAVNLHFKPRNIKNYFKDGGNFGLKINYSYEKKLLGTAGGVKKMEHFLKDGAFVVMSGDGLTDINIPGLIKYHKEKKSFATIVLKEVSAKIEYGLAGVNKENRITCFMEKPGWKEVFTGLKSGINTGIYVFEPEVFKFIPKNTEFDFAKNLFPLLLKEKKKIFGYYADSYWCDIGNLAQYRFSHKDILEGRVKIKIEGKHKGKKWIGEGCRIDPSSKLSGSIIIGKNCCIKKKVNISGYTVLGNDSFVDEGAVLKDCIIWDEAYIGKGVHIQNCIIGKKARVISDISVFDGIIQL